MPRDDVPAPRNPGIDALRGLAIVFVVLQHAAIHLPVDEGALARRLPARLVAGLLEHGYECVFVFFVISGFLIASQSLARWGSLARIDARAFYARRAARIVPCLLVLVAVLSALDLAGVTGFVIDPATHSLGRAIAAALGLHMNWYEGTHGLLPPAWDVLWSLSIEELFYLGLPLAGLLLRRDALLLPVLLALALSLPEIRAAIHHDPIWREKATLAGMAAIATGVLAALLVARRPAPRATTVALTQALGVIGLACCLFLDDGLWATLHGNAMLVLTFSSAALVVAAHWRHAGGTARPWRVTAPLRSFGRLSYEIYLTHIFVVLALAAAVRAVGGSGAAGVAGIVAALALSGALGGLVARVVSAPGERLLRRRLSPSRLAAPAGASFINVSA